VHNCETEYLTFFHKGELNGGIISATRSLSTGIDKSLVEGLTRSGRVWEFKIPSDVFYRWKYNGLVKYFNDLDVTTGIINNEVRFSPILSNELNKFIIK
jgi:hypothetical protein